MWTTDCLRRKRKSDVGKCMYECAACNPCADEVPVAGRVKD